jgi:hypothetical protein
VAAQDEFAWIRTEFIDPFQHDYEAIRPVVLFGETAAERSRQTGMDRSTIADKAKRFVTGGMLGLGDGRTQPTPSEGSIYPDGMAAYILYLKQRYPPIPLREIERILWRKVAYTTNHHTLKRFLNPMRRPCNSSWT